MDLDTLIHRLEERANGGLDTQSPADDCREAAEAIKSLRQDRKKLLDALTSGDFCRTVEHNQGMCDCDKVRTLFERMS